MTSDKWPLTLVTRHLSLVTRHSTLNVRHQIVILTAQVLVLRLDDVADGNDADEAIVFEHRQMSDAVLRVEAGSLYPALHRMTEAKLLKPEWRRSEVGRRARFYALTSKGLRKLEADEKKWRAVSAAVAKVLNAAGSA